MKNWVNNAILFILSQIVSQLGLSIVYYAIIWNITLETQSGVMMTLIILCEYLPAFFVSPFAGVWSDRLNRKVIMIVTELTIAMSTLTLAILYLKGHDYMWLLFAVIIVRAIGLGVQEPAIGSFIPQIVPQRHLMRTNSINDSLQSLVALASPVISAGLIRIWPLGRIFIIDVLTALMAVVIMLFILYKPIHIKSLEMQEFNYFQDLKSGIKHIASHKYLMKLLVFDMIFFFLLTPCYHLVQLQAIRSFEASERILAWIEISFSIGTFLGGVVMTSWGNVKNKIPIITTAAFISGIGSIVLAVIPVLEFYLVVLGVIGVTVSIYYTSWMVLFQESVQDEYRGRTFGVVSMFSNSVTPVGMLLFGPLADFFEIERMLTVTGVLIMATTVAMFGKSEIMKKR